jgi:hypothetical protein
MNTAPIRRFAAASASRGPGDMAASTSPTSMGWCQRIPGRLGTTSIQSAPTTIATTDGNKTIIDTLVLATGFDLWDANFPAIEVVGREGRNLGKWWRDNRFQVLSGSVDTLHPQLPEPGQPVRLLRAVVSTPWNTRCGTWTGSSAR